MVNTKLRRLGLLHRLRELLVALCLLGVGAPLVVEVVSIPQAHAQKKKKNRKKRASKKRAPPVEEKKEEAEPPAEIRTTGPATLKMPVSEKNMDFSAQADKKRDEAIEEIRSLLPKVSGEQKGELVFRLAELFWEKSRFIYFKEFQAFDQAYQKWVDEGRQGKEPKLADYTKESEAYKKQALANYKYVLENHPEYRRLDEVLYIMAYNEYEAGRKKAALKNYSKLIKQYPRSEYVADAYLALGEHYFAANNLEKATKAYNKAYEIGKKADKPATYRYAQYKLAWCDYNAQEYAKALERFKDVIEESERAQKRQDVTGGNDKRDAIQLKREALNDMVLTYSQLGAVKEAYEYLKSKAGRERAYELMTKLAGIYNNQGNYKNEIKTWRFVINLDPDNVNCPNYQASIVQAYSTLGNRDAVRKEVRRLVELYRPGSPWWRKNESDKVAVERARTIAEQRMRELVTEYHRYAQKFKRVDDYTLARDLYKEYLEAFPDSEEAYRMNFYYAEILWDLDQWEEAAEQYDRVVQRDPKGQYTRTAAWNAILAWEKIVKGEKARDFKKGQKIQETSGRKEGRVKQVVRLKKVGQGKEFEPQKIPPAEVKLAAACDRYVEVVPESVSRGNKELTEELIVVKFKAGYIYHNYFHFDEAAKRFGELIERWPWSEYARRGADAILDSYAARENWTELEKWSRTFAKNDVLMKDEKFAKQVREFMEGASFKAIAMVNEEAGKLDKAGKKDEATKLYAEAAQRFEAFVDEFPKSQFAPIALYNATVIYDRARQIDLAIRAANKLLDNYATELKAKENQEKRIEEFTLWNLARFHEMVANYRTAAETYTRFADTYKDNEKAPDALYNAGIFYLGLGDTKNAVASFARYIKEYPKQKDIPDVYMRMALVYEEDEDYKRAAALYGDFEKLHGKQAKDLQVITAHYKHALMLEKAGRADEAREVCQGFLKRYDRLSNKLKQEDVTRLAGGYCAFLVLEPEWQEYKSIQIVAQKGANPRRQMKQIRDALDLKLKKMREIAKKYDDIGKYGSGEWAVAGLYRASEALLEYVKTLREAPDPPPLRNNLDALDMFRSELENIVFPVEDEAIRALEKALATAFELGIYSEYTLAIQDRLRAFKPGQYGTIREMPFFPSAGNDTPTRTALR